MKQKNLWRILSFVSLLLITSCQGKSSLELTNADDLADKRIGVLTGTVYDNYVKERYPNAKVTYWETFVDILQAIESGQCDATFMDESVSPAVLKEHPTIGILEENIFTLGYGVGFNLENTKLRDLFNEFLRELNTSGELKTIVDGWIDNFDTMPIPVLGGDGSGGTIRVGTTGADVPSSFVKDGQLAGYDMDLLYRFATKNNFKIEIKKIAFGGLIASLATNKLDIIINSISITEERSKKVAFSDPYIHEGVHVFALKKNIVAYNDKQGLLKSSEDLSDKRIGVLIGAVYDKYAVDRFPQAKIVYIDNQPDIVLSLENGKCEGAFFSNDAVPAILKQHPNIGILEEGLLFYDIGFGFNKNNPQLREKFNAFLQELKASGELPAIYDRWISDFDNIPLPVEGGDGSGGIIRFATTGVDVPSSAIRDGKLAGYDIDIFYRFATKYNLKIELQKIHFGGLIAALTSGKVDVIGSSIVINEERSKQVAFSDSYTSKRADMLALKKNIAAYSNEESQVEKLGFFAKQAQSFDDNLIKEKRYLLILNGLLITIIISLLSALLGTALGGLICFMRMSRNPIANGFAKIYITIMRGIPILVLLMILFYVIFASVSINAVLVATIAFSMNLAAYVSEMFRTSIESIGKGQTEAGVAMGFSKLKTFIHIVLPQAVRRVMPVYKGEIISLVKMTSIVGYIAVEDLTKASDIIRSRTFDAFFPLIMVALVYFLLAWIVTLLLNRIELGVDPKKKQIKKIQEK